MHAGDLIDVQAFGTWYLGGNDGGGPDGIRMGHTDEPDVVLPSEPIGELIARVGSQLLPVGGNKSFVAPQDGDLYLLFNDRAPWYGDNHGSVTAEVDVYSLP